MRLRDPRLLVVVSAALLSAAIAFPLGILASHQFSDVPDSNTYHADIDAVADAGVTTGCGNGSTYCPSAFVTREQMAAFMNRLGALGAGKTPVVNATKLDGLNSTQFARSDVVETGHINCMGRVLQPEMGGMLYSWSNEALYLTVGSGAFLCGLNVPDGSTLTALRCHVYDASAGSQADCFLVRAALAGGGYSLMADTPDYAATPLSVTLEDLSITNPVVDNGAYSYAAIVFLGTASINLTVSSISVEYTVSGLPVT